MPTPTKGNRLGGSPAHERIILANMASQLFEHGRITTTEARAKRVRPLAERLITKAKRGDQHARRQVMSTIRDKGVVHLLFTDIADTMADREGGYLRITKIGPRKGDNAPMVILELVEEPVAAKPAASEPAATTAAAEPAAEANEPVDGVYTGDEPPAGFDIKGNQDSMKFHTTESPWYSQTKAEVWFDSEESAEAAGYVNAVADSDESDSDESAGSDESDSDNKESDTEA